MPRFAGLNTEQLQAVVHNEGPMLVIAGAGTGKTRVITERITHLITQCGVSPEQILAITFTDKAAAEMQDRVTDLLGTYNIDVNITTFNSFGDQLLRQYAYDIGLSSNLKLMTSTQQVIFLKEHFDELGLDYYAPITKPEGMLRAVAAYFSDLKNALITPEDYRRYLDQKQTHLSQDERVRHSELAQAYAIYIEICRRENVIDFDDQVYLTVELLQKRPNIRALVQANYGYILVDEYQDTNLSQSVLLDLLAGQKANIMAVGDDDQCIYNFRGAAISNILAFKERYPKAKQVALIQNYRSTQQILDIAYRLIQNNNPQRLEAKYQINKQLVGQQAGSPPVLQQFATYEQEAHWIARDIKERLQKGEKASEIAVLLRKNSQAKVLQKYLERESIEYLLIGESQNLYQQPEIKNLLWFLRSVVDPKDSESLYHLLSSDIYDLNPSFLREKVSLAKRQHLSLETVLREHVPNNDAKDTDRAGLEKFFAQFDKWRTELSRVSAGRLCYLFLDETKLLKNLLARAKNDPQVDRQIANLNQFFTTLVEFERIAQDTTAVGFVASLPILLDAGERMQPEDLVDLYGERVRLLTVHKAKGLEFKTVYLFDVTQGTFPSRRMSGTLTVPAELIPDSVEGGDSYLHEERRLMYVAITRAKRNLVMTYSFDHGGKRAKKPSVFLQEIFGDQILMPERSALVTSVAQIELFGIDLNPQTPMVLSLLDAEELRLSTKQIEDYLMCPAEFYFRHILSPPTPPSFALDYGTLIHKVVQFYNHQKSLGLKVLLDQLEQLLEDGWPKEGFLTLGHKEKSLRQAKSTIQKFYEREERTARYPLFIEQPFKLRLKNDVLVAGRFDAVYEDSEGVEIRDYKTGATSIVDQKKADQKARQSLQLGIYALAWRQIKDVLPERVSLDFLDAGFIGTATRTERQLQLVEKKIQQVAESIRSHDFSPGSSHFFCMHPEYGL